MKEDILILLNSCSWIIYWIEELVNKWRKDTCPLKWNIEQYIIDDSYKRLKTIYKRAYNWLLKSKQINNERNSWYKKLLSWEYEKINTSRRMREDEYNILESIKDKEPHLLLHKLFLENKYKFLSWQGVWELSTMPYRDYLLTDHWRNLSIKVKERDGNKCKLCNSWDSLNAHHRTYKNRWKDNEIEDIITLCKNCHQMIHDNLELNSKHEQTNKHDIRKPINRK